jgi:signal transduction histidine kinase
MFELSIIFILLVGTTVFLMVRYNRQLRSNEILNTHILNTLRIENRKFKRILTNKIQKEITELKLLAIESNYHKAIEPLENISERIANSAHRITEGKKETAELALIIRQSTNNFHKIKRILITVVIEDQLPPVSIRKKELIEQVIQNTLMNLVLHNSINHVHLKCSAKGGQIILQFSDDKPNNENIGVLARSIHNNYPWTNIDRNCIEISISMY